MANAFGKKIDTTYLDPETSAYRQVLHRDQSAHTFRWSYVSKFLSKGGRHKTWHVLDAGCGRLVNLAKMLYHNMKTHTTGSYTGVDYGKVPWPETINPETKKFKMQLFEQTDFAEWEPPHLPNRGKGWDLITSFEVLEHVEPLHAFRMLQRMRDLVLEVNQERGYAIISTPNYSAKVGAAKNHVNEMTYDALFALIEAAGWGVLDVYGTFASQIDYKNNLSSADRKFFDQLSEYYDSTSMSLIMAPLIHAHQARNCMWILRPSKPDIAMLTDRDLAQASHSSSKLWVKARRQILKELKDV